MTLAVTVLAAADRSSAGPLALLVIVLLGIATVLLVRNMNTRLKKLPPSFDEAPVAGDPEEPSDHPNDDPSDHHNDHHNDHHSDGTDSKDTDRLV